MTGTLVGDAISPAHLPAGGRAWWTSLSAPHTVWAQVLVQKAVFAGRTPNPVAGSCASEVGHTRLHGTQCAATCIHAQVTTCITARMHRPLLQFHPHSCIYKARHLPLPNCTTSTVVTPHVGESQTLGCTGINAPCTAPLCI